MHAWYQALQRWNSTTVKGRLSFVLQSWHALTHSEHLTRVKAIKAVSRLMNITLARALSKWEYQVVQQQRLERVSTVRCLS